MKWPQWKVGDIQFVGGSVAGVGTCLVMPEIDVCFDVAQGLPFAQTTNHFLITHAHMDHAAGIPYLISQRALNNLKPAQFYLPKVMMEPLTGIMELWSKMEGHKYDLRFTPAMPEEKYPLKGDYFFRTFETVHRIPSQGYTVFRSTKHLKSEFQGMNPHQIVDLRRKGVQVEERGEEPLVSYTGDTQIEFLDRSPWVKKSKILILEVTYLDERKPVSVAREWGHLHLDELVDRMDEIESEHVVLIHFSRRYSREQVKELVYGKIAEKHHDRLFLAPSAF